MSAIPRSPGIQAQIVTYIITQKTGAKDSEHERGVITRGQNLMLPQSKKSHLSDEFSFWEIARGGEEGLANHAVLDGGALLVGKSRLSYVDQVPGTWHDSDCQWAEGSARRAC